jgi:hypothetical protein
MPSVLPGLRTEETTAACGRVSGFSHFLHERGRILGDDRISAEESHKGVVPLIPVGFHMDGSYAAQNYPVYLHV